MVATGEPAIQECLAKSGLPPLLTAFVGGDFAAPAAGPAVGVEDPATGSAVARFEETPAGGVDAAVGNARDAWRGWSRLEPAERGRRLNRVAGALRDHADLLARLETIDAGKPLSQARADVAMSARYFEYYAGMADKIAGQTIPQPPGTFAYTVREPYGVVAHITPWNAPLSQLARGVAPCLAAGNTVVVKPSELTPLTSVFAARLMAGAGLPGGVCNVVLGAGDPVGERLVAHNLVRHITFTGSVAAGRRVGAVAAERVVSVSLELGGKSPTIVCADADVGAAAAAGALAVVRNSGQSCFATTRLLVDARVHDQFVDALAARMTGLSVGHGLDDPDVGPLISARQRDRVLAFLASARGDGAEVVTGGERRRPSTGATSSRRRCCAGSRTTCASRAKRSSGRCSRSSSSAPWRRRSRWPTTPNTGCRPACSPVTSVRPTGWPRACRPARCRSTATPELASRSRSAATRAAASAGRRGPRRCTTTHSSRA